MLRHNGRRRFKSHVLIPNVLTTTAGVAAISIPIAERGIPLISSLTRRVAVKRESEREATATPFGAGKRLMIAQVPPTGVTTVHSVIGDLFAWATVIGFLLLVCFGSR